MPLSAAALAHLLDVPVLIFELTLTTESCTTSSPAGVASRVLIANPEMIATMGPSSEPALKHDGPLPAEVWVGLLGPGGTGRSDTPVLPDLKLAPTVSPDAEHPLLLPQSSALSLLLQRALAHSPPTEVTPAPLERIRLTLALPNRPMCELWYAACVTTDIDLSRSKDVRLAFWFVRVFGGRAEGPKSTRRSAHRSTLSTSVTGASNNEALLKTRLESSNLQAGVMEVLTDEGDLEV